MNIKMMKDEYWYGGYVHDGVHQPIGEQDTIKLDLTFNKTPNQAMPLFLSSAGRCLWSNEGFPISFHNGEIEVPDDVVLAEGFDNLKSVYQYAMHKYFAFRNIILSDALFENPIYNSWIELTFHQNEHDILRYAQDILEHGLPSGVLMIDDGWSDYYGKWSFSIEKFPNPEQMLAQLHKMGFQVMLWVCPFVTADTTEFREARDHGLLVRLPDGKPYICEWWNGYSAALDFSNPLTIEWFDLQLQKLTALGIDGFKFDAGDSQYYRADNMTFAGITPDEQSLFWARYGEKYAFNEYRVTFRAGGMSLLQRLCDKEHSWGEKGIQSLVPNSLLQGLTGHPFCCPDMIGGGEYLNFREMAGSGLDEELFCRHSEIACLMPAMQFSAAPWRVLSGRNFQRIKNSIALRGKYHDILMNLIVQAKQTGEPVVRYMEYEFPHQGMERVTDQFMLGSEFLVAPIYQKGMCARPVAVPMGRWKSGDTVLQSCGEVFELCSPIGEPIVLERLQS